MGGTGTMHEWSEGAGPRASGPFLEEREPPASLDAKRGVQGAELSRSSLPPSPFHDDQSLRAMLTEDSSCPPRFLHCRSSSMCHSP